MATETNDISDASTMSVIACDYLAEKQAWPDAVTKERKDYWDRLREMGCVLADGAGPGMINKGDTLVFLVPSRQFVGYDLRTLLFIFAKMKANEVSICRCLRQKGFSSIVRMWWN